MNDIQKLGLELVDKNLTHKSTMRFKDDWFRFHYDNNGQRGHYIVPFFSYGQRRIKDHYLVKRVLTFTNPGDEGKDDAILGILNLNECKVVAISETKVEFEQFTIDLGWNPYTQNLNKREHYESQYPNVYPPKTEDETLA